MSRVIDLGQGVSLLVSSHHCTRGEPWTPEVDTRPLTRSGYIETHSNAAGDACDGYLATCPDCDTGRPKWTVVSEEPLTLSPSVLCTTCGHHGFVQQGRWVSA